MSLTAKVVLSCNKFKTTNMNKIIILLTSLIIITSCLLIPEEKADTIVTNGKIYTVHESQPWVEAIAIRDGKFLKAGSNDEIEALVGKNTRIIDLKGRFAMPGIIDAHNHALNGADDKANLFIKEPDKVETILEELKTYASLNPDLEIIRGGPWNLGVFPDDNPPKELLDEIVSDRPVYLISQSGHSAWLNSKAFELVGIDKNTPVTDKFIYAKDDITGEPTGRIDEYAMAHVEAIIPKTSPERLASGIKQIQKLHNSYGITFVKLAEGRENWANGALKLADQGELSLRMIISWDWGSHMSPHSAEQAEKFALSWKDKTTDMIDGRSIKIFYDGALDSYTALLLEDYEGKPGFKGTAHHPKESFQQAIKRINKNGIGVIVHVMGDGSARELVDIFESISSETSTNGPVLHMSHCVMALPEDLGRLSLIPNACVDFSPALGVDVPELATLFKDPIGDHRYQNQLNVKAAINANVPVGFGSDWPSSIIPEPNSFWYMQTWITRKLPGVSSAATHNIKQAISLEQAVKAYTLGSAQCLGFDWAEKVGSIEEGKLADFIVLDQNLFEIPVDDIYKTQVELTFVGGQLVFDRTAEESKYEVVDFEISNKSMDNAIDAANLNLLLQDEMAYGGCCHGHEMEIVPGSLLASQEINDAFAVLKESGFDFLRPARSIYWKDNDTYYWIQWTIKDGTKTLWAYDPDLKEAIEVLKITE